MITKMNSFKRTPLSDEQLSQFLEEALPYVGNSLPTIIDHGGCGIFAHMLYNKLSAAGYDATIIAFVPEYSEDGIAKLVAGKLHAKDISEYMGVTHVVVSINDCMYDDNGILDEPLGGAEVTLTSSQLEELLSIGDIWNSDFDRSCIPILQSKMDEVFGKISEYRPGMWSSINTGHVPLNHYSEIHEMDVFGFLNLKN